jgi:hypothetical protein
LPPVDTQPGEIKDSKAEGPTFYYCPSELNPSDDTVPLESFSIFVDGALYEFKAGYHEESNTLIIKQ